MGKVKRREGLMDITVEPSKDGKRIEFTFVLESEQYTMRIDKISAARMGQQLIDLASSVAMDTVV